MNAPRPGQPQLPADIQNLKDRAAALRRQAQAWRNSAQYAEGAAYHREMAHADSLGNEADRLAHQALALEREYQGRLERLSGWLAGGAESQDTGGRP